MMLSLNVTSIRKDGFQGCWDLGMHWIFEVDNFLIV